jgi:non-specific serine/threonine protein kinase
MASKRFDELRGYGFADRVLALRNRTGLTQRELAGLLGVTSQSVHTWEAGLSYPGSERLKQLIALFLTRGAFGAGREAEEAEALWEMVRARAARRIEPFDPVWLSSLRTGGAETPGHRRPPSNLAPALSSFVGRAADVAGLAQELGGAMGIGARMVTLTGIAGSGKTRLALVVAEAMLDGYSDGVWVAELAPLPESHDAEPTLVAASVLAALRLREEPGRTLLGTLIARLKSGRLLLVLDNCEHVVEACTALCTQLLAECPYLQILTSSQYPLGIAAEVVWPVEMLDVPEPVQSTPTQEELERLAHYEAVHLFVERAQTASPGFALTVQSAADVVAICRDLDGLPLALELAAARLNMLPVDELRARLADRFRLLRRGGHTVADRHQTLQATMDWSYRLLHPADRTVLRRLAVFAGGWDLSAAEAVCAGGLAPAQSVLESLDELLARSMIHIYTVARVPRYGMLETVRHYGLQQLHLTGESTAIRDRHLAWCRSLTEQTAVGLHGTEQAAWFARLDLDHENLRTALQWAVDRGLADAGLRVATGLWIYWRTRVLQGEGRRWFAALLAGGVDVDPTLRANALEGAAWLAEDQFDFAQASTLFAASGAIRRELGEDDRMSGLLINRALEARAAGDYRRATALLEESLARHRSQENRESLMHGGLGISLSRLALVLNEVGEYTRARELQEEGLALHRDLGNQEGIAWALVGLGDVARDEGKTVLAREYGERALGLFLTLGHRPGTGFSLNNLAQASFIEGDFAEAARCAEEGAALFRGLKHTQGLAEVLVTLGRIRGAQGDTLAALSDLAEALDLAWQEGTRLVVVSALEALALQAIREGHIHDAVPILGAMAELRRTMGAPVRAADRAELDHVLADARTTLGAQAFADAWRLGQTLSLQDIVERQRGHEVAQTSTASN